MNDDQVKSGGGSITELEAERLRADGQTKWLTAKGVATEYPVSTQYVLDEIDRGNLPAFNIGSTDKAAYRIEREAVEKWWAEKATKKAS